MQNCMFPVRQRFKFLFFYLRLHNFQPMFTYAQNRLTHKLIQVIPVDVPVTRLSYWPGS